MDLQTKLQTALMLGALTLSAGALQDPSGITIPPGDSNQGFNGLPAMLAPKVEIPWNRLVDMT